jgi:hypothetical protein
MPTTLGIGSLVLGGVLLLISVVGGRFKIFGAEVAGEAGKSGRLFAGVVGILLLVLAFAIPIANEAASRAEAEPLSSPRPSKGATDASESVAVHAALTAPLPGTVCGQGRSAFEASNECYKSYRAGDIRGAETACNEGLVKARCAKDHKVEGMILFNLGLCAETRADWPTARALYKESLAARPNEAVERRLNSVELRLQAP